MRPGHRRGATASRGSALLPVLPVLLGIVLWAASPASADVTQGQWAGAAGPVAANDQYGYPYRNAPACTGGGACVADAWNFYQGQCTSWVAYRLNQLNGVAFSNSYGGRRWGNATDWGPAAQALGIPVDGTPAVGSIAWYSGGSNGHVAYVEQVLSPSQVVISEMNYDLYNGFRVRTVSTSSGWPSGFIHVADRPTGPPADGAFVSNNGFVYRVAGGAPIYVSTWDAVGGPQPTTALSDAQFAALAPYPRDGTILDASGGGVFVVAGGAPLYLSTWAAIGGPQPGVAVDQAAVDNAGAGVPWNHLGAFPADGTLLNASSGEVFVVAGGAPLYLSTYAAIGGPRPGVAVDVWDVYNTASPAAHLRSYPADGTLLDASSGEVYVVAGGAPLYLSTYAAIGGPRPGVAVDQWDVEHTTSPAAHLRLHPADGTFLNTSAGHVYRTAGGAPFAVSSWSVFGGVAPYTTIDQWDIDNIASPTAHLSAAPADGTLVEGLPSATFWSFTSGHRSRAASGPAAVGVDDVGLAAFPRPGPPAAAYTPSTYSPPVGRPVTFDAGASKPGVGSTIATYRWVWGDGTPDASGVRATHTFTREGKVSVGLYLADSDGQTGAVGHGITVGDELPAAAYAPSTYAPKVGQTVSFNGSGSTDPDGSVVGYRWLWGDGTADGSGPTPTHVFTRQAKVSVGLYVTDVAGRTAAVGHGITVSP